MEGGERGRRVEKGEGILLTQAFGEGVGSCVKVNVGEGLLTTTPG